MQVQNVFFALEKIFPPGVRDARGRLIGTVLCCFCKSESMHREKCAASRLLQGLTLDPNRKMIPWKTQRGHFVRTDFIEREGLLSHAWNCPRETKSELPLDAAILLQSEMPQDWDVVGQMWLRLRAEKQRFLFYSSLLTCSIYISDHCMFYFSVKSWP